ncbi:glycosyl hydrolase 115 family protein [Demequina sp. NBRC 110055]|uniref:glycosyl hydrolase 115 family protein n=1 Tax=Demequina sp. NBRC 110055 TaxID=1570344 RepID=UPI00135646E7|nr:glycosyl hydrolase 115 family protein [Demequina sp. NBRC 110055]
MTYLAATGGLLIARHSAPTQIAVWDNEDPALLRAVTNLANDIADVCGAHTSLAPTADCAHIVVGTVHSPLVRAAVQDDDLDLSGLDEDGSPRWEAYVIQTLGERLYVVGSDRRGAIYGVYDLARTFGVSPWRWFADVPVRTARELRVDRGRLRLEWPSVKYRGVFINDEEQLEAWARAHTVDGTIGPELYERVFELLLRLGANHLWPAMHVNHFNGDPRNGALAEAMGIVIGTSHCDMLTRSNQNEWEPWLAQQDEHVEYDYSLPGRNRDMLREYWRGGIQQNKNYEIGWTVGMRGIHDSGFVTAAIDRDEALSPEEKTTAKRELLARVIADQMAMLDDELGCEAGSRPLTTFVPYKEVLGLYDSGLDLPDDVTVIWADDNFGYMRRYPSEAERDRSGGSGLYYHSSYWSQPPRSYLFINSIPLAHMRNELRKAWDHGIRTLWVDNVGAIKPLEQDVEFFLRYAWEVGKETTTADVRGFTESWIDSQFSGNHGAEVADIYGTYAQVTNVRKVEHLTSRAFDQSVDGDEAGRRSRTLRDLYDRVTAVLLSLPEPERDAFFQLMAMKVHASYLSHAQFAHADRSLLAYDQGKALAADRHLELSRSFEEHRRRLIHHYNTVMSEGRWSGILTPESFAPPTTALHPAGRPALSTGPSRLGVVVWGDEETSAHRRLELSPHDAMPKWIEVFPTGADPVHVSIEADEWIGIDACDGPVTHERRLNVWLKESAQLARTGTIRLRAAGTAIDVSVTAHPPVAASATSRIEADGVLAILADEPDHRHATATSSWETVPNAGRQMNALMQLAGKGDHQKIEQCARIGYDVHTTTPGAPIAEVHRFPTLDSTGRIRLAIGIDDTPPILVESPTTDEKRGNWWDAVVENVEKLTVRLPYLMPGEHTIWIYGIDEHVALSQVVLSYAHRRRSATGPLPARRPHDPRPEPDPEPYAADLDGLARVARDVYRNADERLSLPPVVYAPADFWSTDTTFKVPPSRDQPVLAPARSWHDPDGRKDVIAHLARGTTCEYRPGALAIDAARALVSDADAYSTMSLDTPVIGWRHTQSETDGRAGLAMHVDARRRRWDDPALAPGLHYRLAITNPGDHDVWALVKYDSYDDDGCFVAVDGQVQPLSHQPAGGSFYTFGTQQVWVWVYVTRISLTAGEHVLSVLAHKSGLRLDRLYLTLDDAFPPDDAHWPGDVTLPPHDEGTR